VTVRATLDDNAAALSPPDTGTKQDTESTIVEWTIDIRQVGLKSLTQVVGYNDWGAAAQNFAYRGEPWVEEPPGRPYFEGVVMGESFTDMRPRFEMNAVKTTWLDEQEQTSGERPSTPEGVLEIIFSGSGNPVRGRAGTFVFDANDEVQDHNSGGINSAPFTAEGIANGIIIDYDQFFRSGAEIIGVCLIEHRLANNGDSLRKSQPRSQD
jgi:phage terminase large subunit-like protein